MDIEMLSTVIAKAIKAATSPISAEIQAIRSRTDAISGSVEAAASTAMADRTMFGEARTADQEAIRDCTARVDAMETGIVRPAIEACEARIAALETAAPPDLVPIENGLSTLEEEALALRVRVDALEHRELSAEAVTKAVDDAIRKEFAIQTAPARTIKRVIRDAGGRVERVVEEAIA